MSKKTSELAGQNTEVLGRKHLTDILTTSLDSELKLYQKEAPTEARGDTEAPYALMRHNKGTKAIVRAGGKKAKDELQITTLGNAYIEIGETKITLENFNAAKLDHLNITTSKILQIIILFATATREANNEKLSFELSLEQYIERTGMELDRKQKSRFKVEFYKALETLSSIKIKVDEIFKGRPLTLGNIPLMYYDQVAGKKNTTRITVIADFLEYLNLAYLMQFFMPILKITDNATHCLHTEYSQYYNQPKNHVLKKNEKIPQAYKFSIHTAINWANGLPTLKEVKESNRAYKERIIEPLEEMLDDPNGMIEEWYWCKAKGERLTDEELNNIGSYAVANILYIRVVKVKDEEQIKQHMNPAIGHILERRENVKAKETRRRNKAEIEAAKQVKDL